MRKRLIVFGMIGVLCLQLLGCGAGSPTISESQAPTAVETGDGRAPAPGFGAIGLLFVHLLYP